MSVCVVRLGVASLLYVGVCCFIIIIIIVLESVSSLLPSSLMHCLTGRLCCLRPVRRRAKTGCVPRFELGPIVDPVHCKREELTLCMCLPPTTPSRRSLLAVCVHFPGLWSVISLTCYYYYYHYHPSIQSLPLPSLPQTLITV